MGSKKVLPEYCRDLKSGAPGRHFVDVPLKTLAWERRKVVLPAYLQAQIYLIVQEFMKSPESTWETFGSPRGPPGDAQGASRELQETPRTPPGASHRTHIKLTSNKHRTHIELTENSQRTKTIYKYLSGVELPIARLWRPVC